MNRLLTTCVLTCAILLAFPAAAAWTECPDPYDDPEDDCEIDAHPSDLDACYYSAGRYRCDRGDNQNTTYYIVMEGTTKIWAFGEVRGEQFCCEYSIGLGGTPIARAVTFDGDDFVELRWDEDYYYRGTSEIRTADGDDEVHGSPYDSCSYKCDDIDVGDGGTEVGDYAEGRGGDDFITAPIDDIYPNEFEGGYGDDKLCGGAAGDDLYGGYGGDVIYGNAGVDVIYGDDGVDWLHGNAGVDSVYGGNGSDYSAYGGAVCGGLGVDYVDGGAGLDTCADNADTYVSCFEQKKGCTAAPW